MTIPREEGPQEIPVALYPGLRKDHIVRAMLCHGGTPARELDVGLHGATYNGSYFCWPQPGPYSMMAAAVRRGRAFLAVDRLGAGTSTMPHSRELTLESSVHVVHQVIEWARDSGYERCNLIGHSLGSMIAVAAAAAHPEDAASLVLTGVMHGNLPHLRDAASASVKAIIDPLLKDRIFDPGYVTLAGKIRGDLMCWGAAQDVIDYDDAHRDVVSMTEFGEAVDSWLTPPAVNVSAHITIPVHVIVGGRDRLFTGDKGAPGPRDRKALLRCEQSYFPNTRLLEVTSIPDTGNCLNLHRSAPLTFDAIHNWLRDISKPATAGRRTVLTAR